jgi:hypothetical protein
MRLQRGFRKASWQEGGWNLERPFLPLKACGKVGLPSAYDTCISLLLH